MPPRAFACRQCPPPVNEHDRRRKNGAMGEGRTAAPAISGRPGKTGGPAISFVAPDYFCAAGATSMKRIAAPARGCRLHVCASIRQRALRRLPLAESPWSLRGKKKKDAALARLGYQLLNSASPTRLPPFPLADVIGLIWLESPPWLSRPKGFWGRPMFSASRRRRVRSEARPCAVAPSCRRGQGGELASAQGGNSACR